MGSSFRGSRLALGLLAGVSLGAIAVVACSSFTSSADDPTPDGAAPALDASTSPDAPIDANGDASIDTSCATRPFGTPVLVDVSELGTGTSGINAATLSADELEIVITVLSNPRALIRATRADRTAPFSKPETLDFQDAPGASNTFATLTPDASTMYWTRQGALGVIQQANASGTTFVRSGAIAPAKSADGGAFYNHVFAARNGTELWFSFSNTSGADAGAQNLERAVFDMSGVLGAAQSVNFSMTNQDSNPVLSDDGLALYFASTRPSSVGAGAIDIFVATRPDAASDFGVPFVVPNISGGENDYPLWLSPDQCRLYLARQETGFKIYMAER